MIWLVVALSLLLVSALTHAGRLDSQFDVIRAERDAAADRVDDLEAAHAEFLALANAKLDHQSRALSLALQGDVDGALTLIGEYQPTQQWR